MVYINFKRTLILFSICVQFLFTFITAVPIRFNDIKKAVIYGVSDCDYYQKAFNTLDDLKSVSSFKLKRHPSTWESWSDDIQNIRQNYHTEQSTSPFVIIYDNDDKVVYQGGSNDLVDFVKNLR